MHEEWMPKSMERAGDEECEDWMNVGLIERSIAF
jgi:hypothetical protein